MQLDVCKTDRMNCGFSGHCGVLTFVVERQGAVVIGGLEVNSQIGTEWSPMPIESAVRFRRATRSSNASGAVVQDIANGFVFARPAIAARTKLDELVDVLFGKYVRPRLPQFMDEIA